MSDEPTQLPDSENPHAAEFAVLEALRAENESLKDQRLRALAEAENIRRRAWLWIKVRNPGRSRCQLPAFSSQNTGIFDSR